MEKIWVATANGIEECVHGITKDTEYMVKVSEKSKEMLSVFILGKFLTDAPIYCFDNFRKIVDINYEIKISYSNDDTTETYGKYETAESAYFEMCKLAAKEAYTQNEEFLETRTCDLYFDAYLKQIDLHYDCDDTYCYYRVNEIFNTKNKEEQL